MKKFYEIFALRWMLKISFLFLININMLLGRYHIIPPSCRSKVILEMTQSIEIRVRFETCVVPVGGTYIGSDEKNSIVFGLNSYPPFTLEQRRMSRVCWGNMAHCNESSNVALPILLCSATLLLTRIKFRDSPESRTTQFQSNLDLKNADRPILQRMFYTEQLRI